MGRKNPTNSATQTEEHFYYFAEWGPTQEEIEECIRKYQAADPETSGTFPEFKRRYFGEAVQMRNPLKSLNGKGYAPHVRDTELEALGYADFVVSRRISDEHLEDIRARGTRITEIRSSIPKI